MVVRVTGTVFELEDGRVNQHPIVLEDVPTIDFSAGAPRFNGEGNAVPLCIP